MSESGGVCSRASWQGRKGTGLKMVAAPWRWWLTPVFLATPEAKIRRITVQSCDRRPYLEKNFHTHKKWDWWSGSMHRPWLQAPVPQKKKR
jgi:hypothetical protein